MKGGPCSPPHLKHHLRSGVPSELLPTVTISPERKAFLRNTGKERSMSRMVVAHCGGRGGQALGEPLPARAYCPTGRNDATGWGGQRNRLSSPHRPWKQLHKLEYPQGGAQQNESEERDQMQKGCSPSPRPHAQLWPLSVGRL